VTGATSGKQKIKHLVLRETWSDLFCDNVKTLEQMLTEYRRDRNVAGVAPSSDQAPANAAAVMRRVVAKINTLTKAVYKDR
jgi:hypothetical protein